jgi:hypothetical protein
MAAIPLNTNTPLKKQPFGEGFLVMGLTNTQGTGAADEWISKSVLGLSRIISAQVVNNGSGSVSRVNIVLNAQGTGQAEGSSPGDLGIENTIGNSITFIVYGTGFRGQRA